jgi:hypothetical protein
MDAVKDEVPYSDTEVQAAVTDMVGLVIRYAKTLAETARTAMGYAQVMAIPALDKLGDAVGQIGSVVDGVLSLFRSYMDALTDKVQYGDAEVQAAVTNMVGVLIVYARALRNAGAAAMDGIQVDAIPTLDRLGDVLGQLSSVTGSVLDIFRAYMATVEDKIRFTDADVQANVKGMVGVLVAFGLALRQAALDVLTARDITELEAIPALEQLGKAIAAQHDQQAKHYRATLDRLNHSLAALPEPYGEQRLIDAQTAMEQAAQSVAAAEQAHLAAVLDAETLGAVVQQATSLAGHALHGLGLLATAGVPLARVPGDPGGRGAAGQGGEPAVLKG